jgi:hypothetical protein
MDRNANARAPDAQLNLGWWMDRLIACATPEAVWKLSGEFIAAWPKGKLDELPPGCQPPRLATAEDVASYAVTLTHTQLSGTHSAPHIHALAMFFNEASKRIARLGMQSLPHDTPRLFLPDKD